MNKTRFDNTQNPHGERDENIDRADAVRGSTKLLNAILAYYRKYHKAARR